MIVDNQIQMNFFFFTFSEWNLLLLTLAIQDGVTYPLV